MEYQRCTRCVMDNTADTTIVFDENGQCNYCQRAFQGNAHYFPNEEGAKKIKEMVSLLKKEGQSKEYDCLMGLSGGLDSSYLAYLGYTWGLRILGVHIDDGYDTEISKENINRLCKAAHIDLKVIRPDAKQFNALTLAYMKAGVPNLAVPQDNILLAFLYDTLRSSGIKYFLSGNNHALESINVDDLGGENMDIVNLKDINKKFGTEKLDKLHFATKIRKYWYKKTGKIVTYSPLNWLDYNRDRAFKELADFCNFMYYGRKHLENEFTAFLQLVWLPQKFGIDKRKAHLSSMIVSGQMTREQALKELEEPMYDPETMKRYISHIKQEMGVSDIEFDAIMRAPGHAHTDYKTDKSGQWIRDVIHKFHI